MKYTRFNPRCYSGTEWSGGDDGDGGGDDDDDPDGVQLDDDKDGDDLPPPPGGNFPGRFLPAGELFLSLLFPPRGGGGIFSLALPVS